MVVRARTVLPVILNAACASSSPLQVCKHFSHISTGPSTCGRFQHGVLSKALASWPHAASTVANVEQRHAFIVTPREQLLCASEPIILPLAVAQVRGQVAQANAAAAHELFVVPTIARATCWSALNSTEIPMMEHRAAFVRCLLHLANKLNAIASATDRETPADVSGTMKWASHQKPVTKTTYSPPHLNPRYKLSVPLGCRCNQVYDVTIEAVQCLAKTARAQPKVPSKSVKTVTVRHQQEHTLPRQETD